MAGLNTAEISVHDLHTALEDLVESVYVTSCIVAAGPLPFASRDIVLRQLRAFNRRITGIHTGSAVHSPFLSTCCSPATHSAR